MGGGSEAISGWLGGWVGLDQWVAGSEAISRWLGWVRSVGGGSEAIMSCVYTSY